MRNHHFRFDVYYMHSNLRWRFRNILRPSQFSEYLNFNIWIYSAFLVALSSHIFYCTSLVLDCALKIFRHLDLDYDFGNKEFRK